MGLERQKMGLSRRDAGSTEGRKEGVQEEKFSVLELDVSVHLPFFTFFLIRICDHHVASQYNLYHYFFLDHLY